MSKRYVLICMLAMPALSGCSEGMNPFAPADSASSAPSDLPEASYRCLVAYGNLLGGHDVATTLLDQFRGTAVREGITVEEALKRELRSSSVQVPRSCSHLQ